MSAHCYCTWSTVAGNRFRVSRKCQTCREAAAALPDHLHDDRALARHVVEVHQHELLPGARLDLAVLELNARQDAARRRPASPTGSATAAQLARFNAARVERKYWGGWSFADALQQVRRTT